MMPSNFPPPAVSRMTPVAFGVSAACLVYGASLALQQSFPALKSALAITLAEGMRPTYYLRVLLSLLVGVLVAAIAWRHSVPETRLAWLTAVSAALSVFLACAFP